MRVNEVTKPSPEQQRIKALQATAQRARDAVQQERKRQRIARAQAALQNARRAASA
jgi:hypothetical protein